MIDSVTKLTAVFLRERTEGGNKMGTWTKGYKIFEKDMTCRDKQYTENSEFTEDKADMCKCGMHFCQNPMDVLKFYDLLDGECDIRPIAEVQGEDVETENIKSVTKHLKIGARLSFAGWIKACVDFLFEKTETSDESDDSDIQSSSDPSAQLAASGHSAQLAASGDSAQLAASGHYARLAASGEHSIVCAIGRQSIAKASLGSWMTLAEFDSDGIVKLVKTEQVDGEKIKTDTFYKLENGEFVEVENGD